MTFLFGAAQKSGQQFLTPVQAELLTASLTRQAEEAIVDEMAQDYQVRQDRAVSTPVTVATSTTSSSRRHPNRGPHYRLVQRNNNRATHAGVKGRLSQKSVALLLAFYHHHCLKCGSQINLTLDHIIPMCKGGRGDITNIQPLCYECNNTKAEQVADYRPRSTLPLVYAIYSLYRLDKLTHSLRQRCHRVFTALTSAMLPTPLARLPAPPDPATTLTQTRPGP